MEEELITRPISGNRELTIVPLTFARARLYIGEIGGLVYSDGW